MEGKGIFRYGNGDSFDGIFDIYPEDNFINPRNVEREFSIMLMEIVMKEIGRVIKKMVKAQ